MTGKIVSPWITQVWTLQTRYREWIYKMKFHEFASAIHWGVMTHEEQEAKPHKGGKKTCRWSVPTNWNFGIRKKINCGFSGNLLHMCRAIWMDKTRKKCYHKICSLQSFALSTKRYWWQGVGMEVSQTQMWLWAQRITWWVRYSKSLC